MRKKRRNRIIKTPLYKQRMKSGFSKPPKAQSYLTKAMEEKQQQHREIMKAPLQGYPQGGYVRRPRNSSIAANDQQEPVYDRWADRAAREIIARRRAENRFNRLCLGISIILIAVGTLIVKFFQ